MRVDVQVDRIRVDKESALTGRARLEFGDLMQLSESIKDHGLINPITVCQDYDEGYLLVAGERRLRASILAGLTSVPVTVITGNELKRKAIEIAENLRRLNLAWPEELRALRQFHEIRRTMYGPATRSSKNKGWGVRETAAEIGKSVGMTNDDLKLAEVIEHRPELANKHRQLPKAAARKIIMQTIEAEELQKQVDAGDIKVNSSLRLGDCTELIDDLDDESIDCLLTDPPFGSPGIVEVGVTKTAMFGTTESNVSDIISISHVFDILSPKLYRKLKPGAHIYVFCGMGESYWTIINSLRQAKFEVDDLPLIWYKERSSIQAKDYHYMSSYQACLFGHRGKATRSLSNPVKNVLSYAAISPQIRVHPLQLPFDLLKVMIENSTNLGETILDCFAGSGAVLAAAKRLRRTAIGFELDEGNYLRATKWLSGD